MAKTDGLGATVLVDDASSSAQTISNDINHFQFSTPRAMYDITGVDKSAHERLLGLADYTVQLDGTFDNGSNLAHAVFKTIPSQTVNRNVKIEPTSGSTPYLSCLAALSDYSITRPASGELTFSVKGDLADGTVPTWS